MLRRMVDEEAMVVCLPLYKDCRSGIGECHSAAGPSKLQVNIDSRHGDALANIGRSFLSRSQPNFSHSSAPRNDPKRSVQKDSKATAFPGFISFQSVVLQDYHGKVPWSLFPHNYPKTPCMPYADQLGWCQGGQWGGSPMAVPDVSSNWVRVIFGSENLSLFSCSPRDVNWARDVKPFCRPKRAMAGFEAASGCRQSEGRMAEGRGFLVVFRVAWHPLLRDFLDLRRIIKHLAVVLQPY